MIRAAVGDEQSVKTYIGQQTKDMRYPILRQKEVAAALWAYRNAVMAEARSEMRLEAFLNETNALSITAQEIEAESEHAIEAVKVAYDALEASLREIMSD